VQQSASQEEIERWLRVSENSFRQALVAKHVPPNSAIEEKAYFGLGTIAMLKFAVWQQPRYLRLAEERFNRVIYSYNVNQKEEIRILAAESHARLGNIALLVDECQTALEEYQKALEITWEADRKELYTKRIEEIRQRITKEYYCKK